MSSVSFKHFVGKKFWVPRARKEYTKKTAMVDGLEYVRIEETLVPEVIEKVIEGVEIYLGKDKTNITYLVLPVGLDPELAGESDFPHIHTYVDEEDISDLTEHEAMEEAKRAAAEGRYIYSY